MHARQVTAIAAVLSFGLLTLEESALAQEDRGVAHSQDFNCYTIKGKAHDTWPGTGSVSTGVITHAGPINGPTQYVYDTDGFPTPDPDTVTFGAALALTTRYGMVKARVLFLFNVATGIWTSIATVDPNASTGKFAGATGTLWYPNGTTITLDNGAQVYPSDVTGQLCLATHRRGKGDQSQ
jgi:hypothetical protein